VTGLGLDWKAEVAASPQVEMILREKDGALVVNLINRGAGEMTMPRRPMVEDLPPVRDITVRIRLDSAPTSVEAIPEGDVCTSFADGVLTIKLAELPIHVALVIR
jgi:hypothetical protein